MRADLGEKKTGLQLPNFYIYPCPTRHNYEATIQVKLQVIRLYLLDLETSTIDVLLPWRVGGNCIRHLSRSLAPKQPGVLASDRTSCIAWSGVLPLKPSTHGHNLKPKVGTPGLQVVESFVHDFGVRGREAIPRPM